MNGKSSTISTSAPFVPSLVKELDDSGFIDKLTREYGLKK